MTSIRRTLRRRIGIRVSWLGWRWTRKYTRNAPRIVLLTGPGDLTADLAWALHISPLVICWEKRLYRG